MEQKPFIKSIITSILACFEGFSLLSFLSYKFITYHDNNIDGLRIFIFSFRISIVIVIFYIIIKNYFKFDMLLGYNGILSCFISSNKIIKKIFLYVITTIVISMQWYIAVSAFNRYADKTVATYQNVKIFDLEKHNGRYSPSIYEVYIRSFSDPTRFFGINIDSDLYRRLTVGQTIRVGIRQGALGFARIDSVSTIDHSPDLNIPWNY